jgi:hypothetical protein
LKYQFHLLGRNVDTSLATGNPSSIGTSLQRQGELRTLVECNSEEMIIFVDVTNKKDVKKALKRHKRGATLIRNEPAVVCPNNFHPRVINLFDKIIDVGRPSVYGSISSNWPQTYPAGRPSADPGDRIQRVVVINAFKYSFIRGQLYGLRSAACTTNPSIDLFGHGWSMSLRSKIIVLAKEFILTLLARQIPDLAHLSFALKRPLNYQGSVSDKTAKLAEYKVSLVVENDPSFLSEKLFDSFFAGTIPVYVGDTATKFGIPSHLYVQAGKTLAELESAIETALSMDYQKWRIALDDWLYSDSTIATWDSERVLGRIAKLALG